MRSAAFSPIMIAGALVLPLVTVGMIEASAPCAGGRITHFNEAAATLWGTRPKLDGDQWCGSWRLY
jgi:hypothetical protein